MQIYTAKHIACVNGTRIETTHSPLRTMLSLGINIFSCHSKVNDIEFVFVIIVKHEVFWFDVHK
jgi:hypothetical protein